MMAVMMAGLTVFVWDVKMAGKTAVSMDEMTAGPMVDLLGY